MIMSYKNKFYLEAELEEEPNELKNELDFINQQTIQEGYWQNIVRRCK